MIPRVPETSERLITTVQKKREEDKINGKKFVVVTVRTRTAEVIDEIVTSASVLTRIGSTIVHVELAVLTLESLRTVTQIRADHVLTGGSVLARAGVAFIYFDGTVTARVTIETVAPVAVPDIFARAVVAEAISIYTCKLK